jgi:hypothetical protein
MNFLQARAKDNFAAKSYAKVLDKALSYFLRSFFASSDRPVCS